MLKSSDKRTDRKQDSEVSIKPETAHLSSRVQHGRN